MKKTVILASFVLAVIFCISFKPGEDKKGLAEVNKIDGYYIFVQCKPVAAYDTLGQVKKTGLVWTGEPTEMFKTLIKKMKKDFPKSDGIIFSDVSLEHATCITFK